ncbi:M13 family metallopeptidase [Ideonella sp. 4Y16]|uniref:M13 family metallopeptidase n=1 Tax=Ideonella alba TaxID=2824118 RepID=UPI001B37DCD8|nr:M13 family metallopeptidase [Ideonella alba]MBQ0945728.1 M13 family metallopeptidase [Ideonella alba]
MLNSRVRTLSLLLALAVATPALTAAPRSGLDSAAAVRAVRPQDDLFRAANGQWLRRTVIPADKPEFGTFVELGESSDQQVRAIIEEMAARRDRAQGLEAQIGHTYAAFLDTAAIDRAGLAPVRPLLAEVDAIDSPSALASYLGRQVAGSVSPIGLGVEADFKNPQVYRLLTWQGGLGLPERDYYLNQRDPRMAQARAAYLRYLGVLARAAGERQPAAAAQRVYALERRLAELHWESAELRDPVKMYNPATPAELPAKAPGFDWAAFLQGAGTPAPASVMLSQPSFVTGAAKLLAEQPLADWKLYAKLHLLDDLAPALPKALRDAHFAFHGKAINGTQSPRPRWQQAVRQVNSALGEGVGQLYVARHFPPEHKAKMLRLVNNLLAAYKDSIDQLSWMSPETRVQAQAKLAKYAVKIGYPERWRDYSGLEVRPGDALGNLRRAAQFEWARQARKVDQPVDRSEWGMTPQTVNAYYNPMANEIVFPAAILRPPFFDPEADDAVNYGAIGAVIGHEISHGFDDSGSQFDGDGALRNWWTDADRQAFDALGQRLVSQYSSYQPLPGRSLDGKLTLGENIADLSGLQVAYKAYRRSLGDQAAPVIDGLSGSQRFFLGWAQAWREKTRPERTLQLLATDPHSPPEYRANGAAVNHDGFHDAFSTRSGDKMWKAPDERIRIW